MAGILHSEDREKHGWLLKSFLFLLIVVFFFLYNIILVSEDEMFGWHHRLKGYEFDQTLGDSEGQGSLARCKSMGLQRVRYD